MQANTTCKNCRYFKLTVYADGAADDSGYCYRYPPIRSTLNSGSLSVYPPVSVTNWCGEFVKTVKK